jgi:branched-subunit amino acid transport protein
MTPSLSGASCWSSVTCLKFNFSSVTDQSLQYSPTKILSATAFAAVTGQAKRSLPVRGVRYLNPLYLRVI